METTNQSHDVFDNLIDVSNSNLGQNIEMVAHGPFSSRNAKGTIAPMSTGQIAKRARLFAERVINAQQRRNN